MDLLFLISSPILVLAGISFFDDKPLTGLIVSLSGIAALFMSVILCNVVACYAIPTVTTGTTTHIGYPVEIGEKQMYGTFTVVETTKDYPWTCLNTSTFSDVYIGSEVTTNSLIMKLGGE